ncbi:MAG: HAMP domain-containing protein [Desulfobacteraceae bacterium]|nr:HAMP domain-containing protein [Desulfobacteraceae bacterium]
MTNKLSIKVSFFVNTLILIVMVAGTYALVKQQSKSLDQQVMDRVKIQSAIGAKMIGKIIEEAIDNGVFSVKDAFDTNYQEIGNFNPPKYHTKYDFYLDKSILSISDEFLIDDSVVFAVAVDKNGYLPTHNTRYQKPITGDVEKDKVGNRTKRIFDDAVGLKAAQNLEKGFIQIYHRDTGVTMWDVSSPIFVKGKHWGGFRIGLSLIKINKLKKDLIVSLGLIIFVILMISTVSSFFVINEALGILRKLTQRATTLSLGQNLNQPIPNTRTDELGELEKVLERIRQSFLIIFKRNKKL